MALIPSLGGSANQQLNYEVEEFELSSLEAINMEVILSKTPSDISKVILNIVGGSIQQRGHDFVVLGNKISWFGYALETVLSSGDKLIVSYIS